MPGNPISPSPFASLDLLRASSPLLLRISTSTSTSAALDCLSSPSPLPAPLAVSPTICADPSATRCLGAGLDDAMAAFNSMPAMPAAPAAPSDAMGLNHGPPQPMHMDSFDPELNFHESLLYVVHPFAGLFFFGRSRKPLCFPFSPKPFSPSPLRNLPLTPQQRT